MVGGELHERSKSDNTFLMPSTLASKSPISQLDTELNFREIIYCWLSEYFDGATHTINTDLQDVMFPAIAFSSGAPTSGDQLTTPKIHMSFGNLRLNNQFETTRVEHSFVTYYILTAMEGDSSGENGRINEQIADRLRLLHISSPKQSLIEKNIKHADITSGPTYRPTNLHHTRLLTVRYQIEYDYSAEN
jgi:hypothetical protein